MSVPEDAESLTSIPPVKTTPGKFICPLCNNIYRSYKALRQHVKIKHSDKISDFPSTRDEKDYAYKCHLCNYKVNDVYNLRSHLKKNHNVNDHQTNANLWKCPLCSYESTKNDLRVHFVTVHDIQVEYIDLEFNNFEQFETWKEKIEKEEMCQFIKDRGACSSALSTKYYFTCHRSGYYISKGEGMRHLKKQGSNKINGYCPAEMKVSVTDIGTCSVKFCDVHVGHTIDVGHLTLTESERQCLASKTASKVPFESIFDEIRDSVTDLKLGSLHLPTNILIAELGKKNERSSGLSLFEKKEQLKKNFLEILDDVSCLDDAKFVENNLKSLRPSLRAFIDSRSMKNTLALQNKSVRHNKCLEPQRRLFSTQKRKRISQNAIKEPEQEESHKIALELIMNSK